MRSAAAAISTLLERAWQIIRLVRRWLPGREIVFVADSSFAALELLAMVEHVAPCQCDHASASRCGPL